MQLESRIIPSLGGEQARTSHPQNRRELVHQILAQQTTTAVKAKPEETTLDIISAAVVVGMTAQFVSFIFGIVTLLAAKILDITLISTFIGLCVSVIAYALMKESD